MHKRRVGANRRKANDEKQQGRTSPTRRRRPWGLLGALVLGIGAAVVAAPRLQSWVLSSPVFVVKTIDVRAPQGASVAAIAAASGITAGMRMTDVRPGAVRRRLEVFRWAERIDVARKLPDAVEITLTPRRPVALVCLGRVLYADRGGVLFPTVPGSLEEVPLVYGLDDTATDARGRLRLSAADMTSLTDLLRTARATDQGLAQRVGQIDLSDARQVRLSLNAGHTVVQLDRTQAQRGLRHLKRLLALIGAHTDESPHSIDLSHSNLAFVR